MEKEYSVLMSVYSKEKPEYLKLSIESMLNQTLPPLDFVLVKDGPLTEELNEVINLYKEKHPQLLNIIEIKKNVGLGKALDEGIKHCRYELIARMDSDDISLPSRCEKQLRVFNDNSEYSIVGTMIDEFYDDPTKIVSSRIVPVAHQEIFQFMKRRSPFNHPTVMYKKNEVLKVGGYGDLPRKQDLDLFSRMINNGCKAFNIAESLVLFRSNEDNFLRRKSWGYCKSYISVQYRIWKRGHCSLIDLLYVICGQLLVLLSPVWFLKWLSNKFLRKIPE